MALLTMVTEWNRVAVLVMSPVHIPTGSSAVLAGVSTFNLVPSDKCLNN